MTKSGVTVEVRDGNLNKAIQRLGIQVAKNGIPSKLKEKRHFTSKTKKKKAHKAEMQRKNSQNIMKERSKEK